MKATHYQLHWQIFSSLQFLNMNMSCCLSVIIYGVRSGDSCALLCDLFFRYHPSADSGNEGSRESTIPFTPVSICACTVSSYRVRSIIVRPETAIITTKCTTVVPHCLALQQSFLFNCFLLGRRHRCSR